MVTLNSIPDTVVAEISRITRVMIEAKIRMNNKLDMMDLYDEVRFSRYDASIFYPFLDGEKVCVKIVYNKTPILLNYEYRPADMNFVLSGMIYQDEYFGWD